MEGQLRPTAMYHQAGDVPEGRDESHRADKHWQLSASIPYGLTIEKNNIMMTFDKVAMAKMTTPTNSRVYPHSGG